MAGKPVMDVRDYPRHDADLIASVARGKNAVSSPCWLVDVSESGALVQAYDDLKEKENLMLRVTLPGLDAAVDAVIARKGYDGEVFYYGLKFAAAGYARRQVRKMIKWLKKH